MHLHGLFGEEGLFLNFTVWGIPHTKAIPINALVDTGSPWLAISPKDRKLLGIPQNYLRTAEQFINIRFAGHKFRRLVTKRTEIHVLNEKNRVVKLSMPFISVLKATKNRDEIDMIPSVIGMDFLSKNNLSLVYKPKKREAYLLLED